jgi:two-component system, cell cycle sensor histidine kinase and response regulator CckA
LTNQLLTFARRTKIEFRPTNIHDVLEETLRIFEPSVKPQITIKRNLSSTAAIINGDDGQIQQAFLNLFINARDAMPRGGKIIIETILDTQNENSVTIKISDNGVGMDKSVQQQIFVPFFSTKEQGKGTGLGLSVVYGVVQGHGGSITFTSEVNKGTTFILTFPLDKLAQQSIVYQEQKKIVGGKESILIVDDELFVRVTLNAMLSDLGYKVKVAENGKEALKYLQSKAKFHLVILDLNMPEMNGKTVFQKIKSSKLPCKVIISSGYSDEILGNDSLAKKVDGFLQKPYKIEDLAKKIHEVMEK